MWTQSIQFLIRPSISLFLVCCLAVGEVGLAGASQSSQEVKIRVVSGEGQELLLGSGVPKDVTVEVVDATGKPVAGFPVGFTFPIDGPRGISELGQSFAMVGADDRGRASVRVKPAGSAGAWSLRVTAGSDSISIGLTNITEISRPSAPRQPENPAGPGVTPPNPPVAASTTAKKSHTGLIVLIVIAAAGGGAAAALSGKKGSSSTPTTNNGGSSIISLTISAGTGTFGTPPYH